MTTVDRRCLSPYRRYGDIQETMGRWEPVIKCKMVKNKEFECMLSPSKAGFKSFHTDFHHIMRYCWKHGSKKKCLGNYINSLNCLLGLKGKFINLEVVYTLCVSTSTCLQFIETVESSITGDVTQLPPTAVWIFYMAFLF